MSALLAALPAALVLTPLFGAVVTLLVRTRPRAAGAAGLLVSLLVTAGALALATGVTRHGTVGQRLGGWEAPLGIAARADATSVVLLVTTAVVGLGAGIYAGRDDLTTGSAGPGGFWPAWLLAWAGANTTYVAGDLFTLYVGLEVVGLAAVGLVALGGPKAWGPALRYLFVAVLGSLLYLVAVGIVYGATGTLDITLAGQRLAAEPMPREATLAALVLAAVGLSLKTALVPLHGWLPPAHAASAPAVSPILSALVIKASFVVLVRLWFEVLGPHDGLAAALGVLAAAALLWGGIAALRQRGFKRIVAYSTVAQVGYLYLLFPLASAAEPHQVRAVWFGVLALLVAHALAKAAIFMSAGTLVVALGDDDLDRIVGAARTFPMLGLTVGLATVSLAGLPISLAFTGKWHLLITAAETGRWWWVVVLVAATLLSAAYLLRPLAALLRASDEADAEHRTEPRPLPRRLQLVPLALALAAVLTGLWSGWLADLAAVPGHAPASHPVGLETARHGDGA